MAIIKEEIKGTKIFNEIKSSNLKSSVYDTESKTLIIEFTSGIKYRYEDVGHQIYTQFRMSKSQGQFFNSSISKNFKYQKL
jgi:hypothetical protein